MSAFGSAMRNVTIKGERRRTAIRTMPPEEGCRCRMATMEVQQLQQWQTMEVQQQTMDMSQ